MLGFEIASVLSTFVYYPDTTKVEIVGYPIHTVNAYVSVCLQLCINIECGSCQNIARNQRPLYVALNLGIHMGAAVGNSTIVLFINTT